LPNTSRVKASDPYLLFFPLGILLGLAGVVIWPLFYFGVISGYWGLSHAFVQADGFLFCFIAGFLLTALPRFTGTEVPSRIAQWSLAAIVLTGSIALELQQYQVGQTAFVFAYAMLFALAARRFLQRHGPGPETFSLIGLGILTGLFGAVLNALGTWMTLDAGWALAGKRALTEGMTLLLVLGVGGFLGPRLLGFDKFSVVQIAGVAPPKGRLLPQPLRYLYLIGGLLLVFSIVAGYVLGISWMSFVRAIVATIILGLTVEPWRFPAVRSTLSWCVWTANVLTMLGLWLAAILPQYRVDFLHVVFIGGFSLLILAVGMRVVLSHGGHGLTSELKNWPLRVGLITGSIAMLARVGAPFSPKTYSEHLAMAAVLWIIGLGFWGWRLIGLIAGRKKVRNSAV